MPGGYNTAPGDDPADARYAPRIVQPGNYRRTLFGAGGRTSGVADVDRGFAELANGDGALDEMRNYAFDGYDLVISSIASRRAPFASRKPVLRGTMEQIEVTWDEVRLRLRSRLAILDVPIQTGTYAGTTTDGTKVEAEGGEDLKKAPKPLIYGAPLNVPAVLVNRWSQIYQVGQRFDAIVRVRDKGAVLTFSGQDFTTLAALRSATIPGGQYATAKNLGLVRVGGKALVKPEEVEAVLDELLAIGGAMPAPVAVPEPRPEISAELPAPIGHNGGPPIAPPVPIGGPTSKATGGALGAGLPNVLLLLAVKLGAIPASVASDPETILLLTTVLTVAGGWIGSYLAPRNATAA